MRTILHSDCNGFFASVECLYNPQFRDKPVAVCGDKDKRHGIILAKNEIAKKFNVKTGEPIWQAQQKCPELVTASAHYDRYIRFSKLCREIYSDYTDNIEPFGLDEAWLDVTGSTLLCGNGKEIAEEIRHRIKKELGITVSIGVSFNKIFAKLGSDYKKPDAVTVITKENYKQLVWKLKVSDLLYVGRATENKLRQLGVFTIGDLATFPIELLRKNFGKWADILYSFSNGLDFSPVMKSDEVSAVKSIGNSTTAVRDLENFEDAKIIFMVLCDSVCRRMREQGYKTKNVCISIRNTDLFAITRQKKLEQSTNLTNDVLKTVLELFKESYSFDRNIRSLGVSVSDFESDTTPHQASIFVDETQIIRKEQLDSTLDNIKSRFGSFAVKPAKLMFDRKLSGFSPKEEHTVHPVSYF
ncbi:MAG: DNA polymerase IV [Ruminococcaceae bacterium]|nr:DNA polymerase IV [Oscillospiraceae bacterium]